MNKLFGITKKCSNKMYFKRKNTSNKTHFITAQQFSSALNCHLPPRLPLENYKNNNRKKKTIKK